MPTGRAASEPATALGGDARLPLYERLREALLARIKSGEFAPGAAIPAEAAIAAQYEVALGTARRAVSQLVEEGVLDRRQGSGTFVRAGAFANSMFRFFRLEDLAGGALRPGGRLLAREIAPAPDAAADALGLPRGAPSIRLSRLRVVGGEPILAEDIVLPLEPFRAFLDVPAEEVGPLLYPVYAAHCGLAIARAEEVITIVPCPAPEARLLRCRAGASVVCIERLAFSLDDTPREWRRSYGPTARFRYRVDIR